MFVCFVGVFVVALLIVVFIIVVVYIELILALNFWGACASLICVTISGPYDCYLSI